MNVEGGWETQTTRSNIRQHCKTIPQCIRCSRTTRDDLGTLTWFTSAPWLVVAMKNCPLLANSSNILQQQFSTGGHVFLTGHFRFWRGHNTMCCLKNIKAFLRSNSVALQKIYFSRSLSIRTVPSAYILFVNRHEIWLICLEPRQGDMGCGWDHL